MHGKTLRWIPKRSKVMSRVPGAGREAHTWLLSVYIPSWSGFLILSAHQATIMKATFRFYSRETGIFLSSYTMHKWLKEPSGACGVPIGARGGHEVTPSRRGDPRNGPMMLNGDEPRAPKVQQRPRNNRMISRGHCPISAPSSHQNKSPLT